jgi:hypothetical protein
VAAFREPGCNRQRVKNLAAGGVERLNGERYAQSDRSFFSVATVRRAHRGANGERAAAAGVVGFGGFEPMRRLANFALDRHRTGKSLSGSRDFSAFGIVAAAPVNLFD